MLRLVELIDYKLRQIIASEKNMRLWLYLKLGTKTVTYHVENLSHPTQKTVEFRTLRSAVDFFNNSIKP